MTAVWSSWANATLLAPTVMDPLSHLVRSLSFHFLPVNHDSPPPPPLYLFNCFFFSFFSSFFRHPDIKVIYFPTPFSFHLFILLLCHTAKNKKTKLQFHHHFPQISGFLNCCDKCSVRCLKGVSQSVSNFPPN